MKREHYQFRTNWLVEAPLKTAWQVISLPQMWHVWWPDLKTVHVLEQPAKDQLEGTLLVGVWRFLSGYKLQVVFDVEKAKKQDEILIRASGDLEGYILVQLKPRTKNKTNVRLTWDVKTLKPWMNWLSPYIKKFFVKNHDLAMRRGERGLNKFLIQHLKLPTPKVV